MPDVTLHYKFTHFLEQHRKSIGMEGKTVLRTSKKHKLKEAMPGDRTGSGDSNNDATATTKRKE